jgi:hypothetical protein
MTDGIPARLGLQLISLGKLKGTAAHALAAGLFGAINGPRN